MAKEKKRVLSLDEQLEQALVAESEQPYTIPENWVWTKIDAITSVVNGGTPSTSIEEYYTGGDIPWITPADLSNYNKIFIQSGAKKITSLGLEKSSAKLIPPKSVLLTSRAPIGYVAIAQNELCTNQGFKNFLPSPCYIPQYLYWYLKGITHILESRASGTTFLELSASKVKQVEIPLPPLTEQQRIVTQIESLFQKLDGARDLVQNALDNFETRKAAILHKAFTGELTASWRIQNNLGLDSWDKRKINSIAKSQAGYAFNSKSFSGSGIQVIRMGNLFNGMLDLSRSPVYMDKKSLDAKVLDKYTIKTGAILLTLTGTKYKRDYGYAVLINETHELLLNQRILSLYPVEVESHFLLYYLRSNQFRNAFFSNETGGVNQGNVSSRFVENIEIPFPSKEEQQEIVRILDNLLENEQKAKDLCNILDQIDLMKKSILARAFRGELGTNDPGEESALELLKEVLTETVSG